MPRENPIENIGDQLLTFAKKHGVPCMSSATEQRLSQYLMTGKPKNICEIGSAIGYSTFRFATLCAAWGGRVTSFEISHPSYMLAIYSLRQTHTTNACIYHADILDIDLESICTTPFDFIFIDGAKAEYAAYIEQLLPFCASGCTLICDDVLMYKEKVAPVYILLEKYGYTYDIIKLDTDDGILQIKLP